MALAFPKDPALRIRDEFQAVNGFVSLLLFHVEHF